MTNVMVEKVLVRYAGEKINQFVWRTAHLVLPDNGRLLSASVEGGDVVLRYLITTPDTEMAPGVMASPDVLEQMRRDYSESPDPYGFLAPEFTVYELRKLHEAINGVPLQKETFRRRMIGQLHGTGFLVQPAIGRPTELFTLAPDVN